MTVRGGYGEEQGGWGGWGNRGEGEWISGDLIGEAFRATTSHYLPS